MRNFFVLVILFLFGISSANAGIVYVPTDNSVSEFVASKTLSEKPASVKKSKALKSKKLNFFQKMAIKMYAKQSKRAGGDKKWVTALLLVIFLGGLGIHRFYLGYTWQGIVQLLTLGGLGIWTLIDLIRIITRSLGPKNGEYVD